MRVWAARLLIVVALLGSAAVLSYSGFCIKRFGYLSDDDIINAAIDDALTMSIHVVEAPSGGFMTFRPSSEVRYRNRSEFRQINPDCCKIVPHDPVWVRFRHQLCGQAARSVLIRYTVRYVNDFGTTSQMEAAARRAVGNCGQVLNTGH